MADGFLFGSCSKCCRDCDCTCESSFGIFVNGRSLATSFVPITDFVQMLPGVQIASAPSLFEIDGFVDDPRCDDDGNLIVRVIITARVELQKVDNFDNPYQAVISEDREYLFDLSGCADDLITGVGVGAPNVDITPGGFFYDPPLDAADFAIQWDDLLVQAWCGKGCDRELLFEECEGPGCPPFEPVDYCQCYQPDDWQGLPLQDFFFFADGRDVFSCRLNPLP